MESKYFYRDLPGFTDFAEVIRDENFSAIPRDWAVVITDVKGSTKAIETGQYKDVNTIGLPPLFLPTMRCRIFRFLTPLAGTEPPCSSPPNICKRSAKNWPDSGNFRVRNSAWNSGSESSVWTGS